ncbi:hypothetical protein BH11MYX2_BH11MYX2_38260 [soil metagenome]
MQRAFAFVALLAACAQHTPPVAEPVPAACGLGRGDYSFEDDPIQGELVLGKPPKRAPDAFEAVAFLNGCFRTWHIDYGWDLCFSRDGDGLVGTLTWHSVMSAERDHGALLITDLGGTLHIESSEWQGVVLSADAVRIAPGEIAFGADGVEQLVLRRGAKGSLFTTFADSHTVELKPQTPRASATSS